MPGGNRKEAESSGEGFYPAGSNKSMRVPRVTKLAKLSRNSRVRDSLRRFL